jgi:prophage regulatory protein
MTQFLQIVQFLRLKEVQTHTGLSRSSVYLRIKQGTFPKPVPLGSPHTVGWIREEIAEWCAQQIRAARPEQQPAA